jgi:DNA invertase Pin-like site-specific DNA recombinase
MSKSNLPHPRQPATGGPERSPDSTDRLVAGFASAKIRPQHWERLAVIYVRQSSPRQVIDHQESKARQYLLADHAVRLGWPKERILTIDEDQGNSGTTADGRFGFQRLLAEVTMNHVGMILGLEMSRLARSDKDWHHLLELCAIFDTTLADQDGVYDPADPNDRLLLGLKGTMSTLELHTMRNRLEKGKLFKAQRGELFLDLPSGYVKVPSGGLALDPDEQVRAVVRLIFEKFTELGSVRAVFHYLLREGIRLGIRPHDGPNRGQVEWRRPCPTTLYSILHHPFYAGAYAYGRNPVDPKRKHSGRSRRGRRWVSMEEWKVLKRDCLPAYITWEQYLQNQEQLRRNCSGWEMPGAPRQGEALLGGLLVCGQCGMRMSVYYACMHRGRYECRQEARLGLERTCRGLSASVVDALVAQQVWTALEPTALELSLRAGEDIQRERERQTRHWKQQLERARYETRQAERCYRAVDPENRLVARTLEQQWEQSLRQERQRQEEYDRFLQQTAPVLSPAERERIRALASDIPGLWHSSTTTAADRKAILRCLVDRVVVHVEGDTEYVDLTIHWAGGFVSQHQVRRPVATYGQLRDFDHLVERLRELQGAGSSAAQIADQLNQEGFYSPKQRSPFNKALVRQLLSRLGLSSERPGTVVLGPHEWWASDLARELQIPPTTLQRWIRRGWLQTRRSPLRGFRILWADCEEFKRLEQLRAYTKAHAKGPFPAELTVPKRRPGIHPKRKREARH